ncbi:hypothetical protein MLD38_032350 [Melastoma candidum]|uniref:Uncharacterized protein n=1 Tax=Melastoma candidum TaxID=119954 RepID=A0ACB9M396_9MYRT|nr:hypothetical protein MLD38_032350 [Melastoma candidum]
MCTSPGNALGNSLCSSQYTSRTRILQANRNHSSFWHAYSSSLFSSSPIFFCSSSGLLWDAYKKLTNMGLKQNMKTSNFCQEQINLSMDFASMLFMYFIHNETAITTRRLPTLG